uniref:Uncharacterized protein n=1 Tax=Opuntia streptacantha TaxID=393608 RepID=A0A7C9DC90_OPUST
MKMEKNTMECVGCSLNVQIHCNIKAKRSKTAGKRNAARGNEQPGQQRPPRPWGPPRAGRGSHHGPWCPPRAGRGAHCRGGCLVAPERRVLVFLVHRLGPRVFAFSWGILGLFASFF